MIVGGAYLAASQITGESSALVWWLLGVGGLLMLYGCTVLLWLLLTLLVSIRFHR